MQHNVARARGLSHIRRSEARVKGQISALALGAMLCVGTQASAAIHTFPTVFLDGAQEAPPNASPGTGSALVTFDDVSKTLTVSSGVFSGFTGNSTVAHVHGLSGPGVASGVLFGLTIDTGVTSGTFSGSGVLSATNEAGLFNDLTYINLHSSAFPGGEIRGQILVPEPASMAAISLLGGALLLRRRREDC